MVYVYSKNDCGPCQMIKTMLVENGMVEGVDWQEKNIEKNETNMKELEKLGFQSVPVVTKDDEFVFHGFRPDLLNTIL